MYRVKICLLLFISVLALAGTDPQPGKSVIKDIEKRFGASPVISGIQFKEEELSDITNFKEGDLVFSVLGEGGKRGYLLSTCARGRYDLFDYTVIYSDSLSVVGVKVTTYRSSHGGAICSKGWLRQFQGYQGGDIKLGKDIDSVSGATLSASSMVADMQRCHELMVQLEKHFLLP